MELLTWTTEDIKYIADDEGIELTEEQIDAAENFAYEYLNYDDQLNELIWDIILEAIMKAKES